MKDSNSWSFYCSYYYYYCWGYCCWSFYCCCYCFMFWL